jgi:hypothetical protein
MYFLPTEVLKINVRSPFKNDLISALLQTE